MDKSLLVGRDVETERDSPIELLRCLFRRGTSVEEFEKELSSFSDKVWRMAFRTALREGLDGYAYLQLKTKGLEGFLPEDLKETISQQVQRRAIVNDAMSEALTELVQKFLGNRLRFLVLKGMAWQIQGLYPHPGFKSILDIDVWVSPRDAKRAESLLEGLGYLWKKGTGGFQTKVFFREKTFTTVDLHGGPWLDHAEGALDFEACWARRREEAWKEITVALLSPQDALVHRLAHDQWSDNLFLPNLKGALDTVLLLERFDEEMDWVRLANVLDPPERRLATWLCFTICEEFFSLPERARGFLEDLCREMWGTAERFRKYYFHLKSILRYLWGFSKWSCLTALARHLAGRNFLREMVRVLWEEETVQRPSAFFRYWYGGPNTSASGIFWLRWGFFLRVTFKACLILTILLIRRSLFARKDEKGGVASYYCFFDETRFEKSLTRRERRVN